MARVIPAYQKAAEASGARIVHTCGFDSVPFDMGNWYLQQVMFERHGEFAKAASAVRNYRSDLQIEFPTLVAGLSETDEASKALPMLSGIYGYPTAILVDRRGVVRDIHTGFAGPATGRHHEEYVREFRDDVERLLTEN